MPPTTIRGVPDPDDIDNAPQARAARPGMSPRAYARELQVREAVGPGLAETAARLERETRAQLSTTDILDAIEDGRDRR
ncbi:antitoxin [Streptomyces sp. NPDC093085]|uniref:antitoxin n=1 Tax=Streptomyces sp. NPDC093085 TaxID=3155068 RepID=UPI00342F5A05